MARTTQLIRPLLEQICHFLGAVVIITCYCGQGLFEVRMRTANEHLQLIIVMLGAGQGEEVMFL